MTDAIFEYEENKLLRRRPTKVREKLIRALEARALFEEVAIENPVKITSYDYPLGSDAFRFVGR